MDRKRKFCYDYSFLKLKMFEKNVNKDQLAEAVGITKVALYNKLANKTQFKQSEMIAISDFFNIEDPTEFRRLFFCIASPLK